jgi:hypothetical protein
MRIDLEVLAQQIRRSLRPNPTVSNHRQMFYMLANIHHWTTTGEALPPPHRFWYNLQDLPLGVGVRRSPSRGSDRTTWNTHL